MHRRLWPGYQVPSLLKPLTAGKRSEGTNQWFSEQTVLTGIMMAILAFGCSAPKRNPTYRALTAQALIALTHRVCHLGTFQVTVVPIGHEVPFRWDVPASTILPIGAYVSKPAVRTTFTEEWGWATEESDNNN